MDAASGSTNPSLRYVDVRILFWLAGPKLPIAKLRMSNIPK